MRHIHHGKASRRITAVIGYVNDRHHAGGPQFKHLLVLLGGRLEPYGGHHLINGPAAEIHNGISHLLQPAFAHILVGKHNVALSLMVYD